MMYQFFCTHMGTITEVFPRNFNSTKFVWEQEEGEIFYRKKLDGELRFINKPVDSITDYDYFYGIETGADRCEEISFLIRRSCDNGDTYEDYWNGYFAINEGTFEIDSCIFSTKINVDDKYRCYIEDKEKEFNINEVSPVIFTNLNITENYEFYTCRDTEGNCDASRPEPASTWLVFHTEVVEGITTTIYYREKAITACQGGVAVQPSGDGWEEDTSYGSCTNGFAKFVREPVDVVANNPNPDVMAGNCDGIIATPPPRRKILTVTKSATTPTPVIIGPDVIDAAFCTDYEFKVIHNPGSTYVWTISGSGNSIASGQGTSVIQTALANGGTVTCVETSACGASSAASRVFTNPGTNTNIVGQRIIGRSKVCENSTAKYYFRADYEGSLAIASSTSSGTIITTIGSGVYELSFGTAGTVLLQVSSGGSCGTVNTFNGDQFTVTVTGKPTTPDIEGLTNACKDGSSVYWIPESDSVSYEWVVTGGSIASGQGTNEIEVTWDGTVGDGTVEIFETGCGCGWIQISDCVDGPSYWWCPDVVGVTLRRTRLVKDVLDYAANFICGCHSCIDGFGEIKSDFFNINPVGDSPGYVAGENYVTQDVQKLTYLSITAKEAILNSANSEPANKGVLTWGSITKMLKDMFQVYWYVDASNNIRFEHISFYQRTVAYNLTIAPYLKFKTRTKYSYDKPKMPKYERFEWMEATNTDFVGAEIRYDSICVNQDSKTNVEKRGADKVTTDILFIEQSPDDISKEGFVFLVNDHVGSGNGDYEVSIEAGLITGDLIVNAHLSWANLHYNYFRYDRVLLQGYMNLAPTNFITAKRFKKQNDVSFPFCCDNELEPLEDLITTDLGDGIIEKSELDNKTNMITITLLQA